MHELPRDIPYIFSQRRLINCQLSNYDYLSHASRLRNHTSRRSEGFSYRRVLDPAAGLYYNTQT